MEYETSDGWNLDNIYPLQEFVDEFDEIARNVYELRNCQRTKTLVGMRDDLLESIERMTTVLEQIDDEDKVVVKEE